MASFPRDGGGWQRDSIGRFRSRRVVVKARVVKLASQRGSRGSKVRGVSKAADAHLRYLERDGVTRDGEKGRAYSAFENEADGRAFIERDPAGAYTFYLTADVKRANGALSILGLDTQGSVRRLTDASGVLYRASTYEPFGAQVETVINPLSAPERK
ncbi:MAG: hypothetical protein P4M09_06915, partial [Devosia sp.]|nr:hypothetical protein [Devosia sp.]